MNEDICHLSPPILGCQVKGGVALLVPGSEGGGILVDQEADNPNVQVERERGTVANTITAWPNSEQYYSANSSSSLC